VGALGNFWCRHPALLIAMALLLGLLMAFSGCCLPLIPGALILLSLLVEGRRKACLSAVVIAVLAFFIGRTHYHFPEVGAKGIRGRASITVTTLREGEHYGSHYWLYHGRIKSFVPEGWVSRSIASNVPYTLRILKGRQRFLGDKDYVIDATLKRTRRGGYFLAVDRKSTWESVSGTWSLAEMRYCFKKRFADAVSQAFSNQRVAGFLIGLSTGDFVDKLVSLEFGRFGLQHIMAISGFHFAIIAAIFSFGLRFILRRNSAAVVLGVLLSGYFFFLGCGSSIMRAYMMALIVLLGQVIERRPSAINSLGVAMIVVLACDPLGCRTIAFQFSFSVTAAILMLYPGVSLALEKLLQKHHLNQMIHMSLINQHLYTVLVSLRQVLALTLAVHLVAVPLVLYHFHKFAWMGLLYNLFFPFLVSISMVLLIVGLLAQVAVPAIGSVIHYFNEWYTDFLLGVVFNMPVSLDFSWRVHAVPIGGLVLYLCFVFSLGIICHVMVDRRKLFQREFVFL